MTWDILTGDCRDLLAQLPARSVHTVVTSPPYFGLRDYGTGEWEGGDEACDHARGDTGHGGLSSVPCARGAGGTMVPAGGEQSKRSLTGQYAAVCGRCGATRKDQQLGLEPTPQDFVDALVQVFREVRRVLRDDGTVWLNLGDSYARDAGPEKTQSVASDRDVYDPNTRGNRERWRGGGTKAKDLLGIPWMVAFALRADGWYLRSDIIWNKPNPMPESVTDRPTRSHEFIFLLSKNSRYFYDADSIREDSTNPDVGASYYARRGLIYERGKQSGDTRNADSGRGLDARDATTGRNKRDVWTVSTKPYPGAHFATFPADLIEPCVLAGCPERACSACGAPWERIVENRDGQGNSAPSGGPKAVVSQIAREAGGIGRLDGGRRSDEASTFNNNPAKRPPPPRTVGFEPSCSCNADPAPGIVLDPFAGAGTTGIVAVRNRRAFIGLELNPEYAQMARDRIATDIRLGHRAPQRVDEVAGQIDIFEALS